VKRYLDRRRIICTRIEVAPPKYVAVTVTARVQAQNGASLAQIRTMIVAALRSFLDPLIGGPAGLGWPFGRTVYRAEILKIIADVPGVDHVLSLSLAADNGSPKCGDMPICPTWLATSGPHRIEVIG
jgi:hypothetical protein